MKKVAIYTLGCKTNQYESNAIIQDFIRSGYEVVDFEDKADVYIVNTCTVTNISDRKSRQVLRRAKHGNKDAILVATGCYTQKQGNMLDEIDEIDIIVGNNEKKDIVKYVEDFANQRTKQVHDIMQKSEYTEFGTVTYTEKTRAVIKIQDGCNNFCTYCIIPYVRGRVRSRKLENIITEVEDIAKKGIKEVVLTGIHIASYGKDLSDVSLIDLLEEINKVEGIERIRLGSLEPNVITDEFVDRLKKLSKVCHQFHLSLQSCDDNVLERMNRKYNAHDIKRMVNMLKDNFEDTILTADIIVGFPGETEEEFTNTHKLLEEIKLYKIHVFKYSKREGTKAATMNDQVPSNIQEERSKKVIELSRTMQRKYNEGYIGKNVKVLVEELEDGMYKGHTENYLYVWIEDCRRDICGEIVDVKINNAKDDCIIGTLI